MKQLLTYLSAWSWADILIILFIIIFFLILGYFLIKFFIFYWFDPSTLGAPDLGGDSVGGDTPSTPPVPGDSPSGTGGSTGGWSSWVWVALGVGGVCSLLIVSDLLVWGWDGYVFMGIRNFMELFEGGPGVNAALQGPGGPVAQDMLALQESLPPREWCRAVYRAATQNASGELLRLPVLTPESVRVVIDAMRFFSTPEGLSAVQMLKVNPGALIASDYNLAVETVSKIAYLDIFKHGYFSHSGMDLFAWLPPSLGAYFSPEEFTSFGNFCYQLYRMKYGL